MKITGICITVVLSLVQTTVWRQVIQLTQESGPMRGKYKKSSLQAEVQRIKVQILWHLQDHVLTVEEVNKAGCLFLLHPSSHFSEDRFSVCGLGHWPDRVVERDYLQFKTDLTIWGSKPPGDYRVCVCVCVCVCTHTHTYVVVTYIW